jgi:hypothetical protein
MASCGEDKSLSTSSNLLWLHVVKTWLVFSIHGMARILAGILILHRGHYTAVGTSMTRLVEFWREK